MDFYDIDITPDMEFSRIYSAYAFAEIKHKGQLRKFTDEPYFNHPLRVATMISKISHKEYMIKSSLLHDVIEDTNTTYYDIKRLFGNKTAKIVSELTIDESKKKDLGGKKNYLVYSINKMSSDAFTIKLVDRLDNVQYLSDDRTPEDFRKWYVKETFWVLNNIKKSPNDVQLSLINDINKELLKY